jgi:uroporphyrinogen-III synthase
MQHGFQREHNAVLTRPLALQTPWRTTLTNAGVALVDYPLSEFEPLVVEGLAAQIAAAAAVLVISPSAAQAAGAALASARRVYVPGPGTEQAVKYQKYSGVVSGYAQHQQYFDAENMLQYVARDVAAHGLREGVLVLRGERSSESDALGDELAALGVPASFCTLYRNSRLPFGAARAARLRGLLAQPQVWVLAQTRAVDWLAEEISHLLTTDAQIGAVSSTGTRLSDHCCVAIHPRIGKAAQSAGFGRVICCAPDAAAVLDAVKSARE